MAHEMKLDHVKFTIDIDAVTVRRVEHLINELGVASRNAAIALILRRATERVELTDEDVEWIESVIATNRAAREAKRAENKKAF